MIRAAAGAAAVIACMALALPGSVAAAGQQVTAGGDAFCQDGIDLEAVKTRLHWAHVRNPALCGGGEIAEPAGDWSCDPVPVCGSPEAESHPAPEPIRCVPQTDCRQGFRVCHRRYRCRAQSDAYNFEKVNRDRREAAERNWEQRTRSDVARIDTCGDLAAHLAACTPYRCERTHPVLPQELLRLEVLGRDDAGCRFRETVAGGMLRTCTLLDSPPASPDPDADPVSRALVGADCEIDLPPDPRPGQ